VRTTGRSRSLLIRPLSQTCSTRPFEYLTILDASQNDPRRHPTGTVLDVHKLWLNDIVGHLAVIKSESNLIKAAREAAKNFDKLHHEALALIDHSMNGGQPITAVQQLTDRAVQETVAYLEILRQLYQLRSSSRVLGSLPPDLIDHFYREQSYYLSKLGAGSQYHLQALTQRIQDLQKSMTRTPQNSPDLGFIPMTPAQLQLQSMVRSQGGLPNFQ